MPHFPKACKASALAGLLLALPAPSLFAALVAGPGTSAAAFLDLGYGARAVAQGEAFVSVADDVSALHYNPAGLAYPAQPTPMKSGPRPFEMMLSESLLVQDVQMTQFAVARRPCGVGLTRLSVGGIEARAGETANPDGTISASDMLIGAACAQTFGGVAFGAEGKFIRETIGSSGANAYAADFGALKRLEDHPLSLGAQVANIGTGVKYADVRSPLPLVIRAGATYGLTKSFPHALTFELDFPRDASPVVRLGAEYAGFGPLALRAGFRSTPKDQRSAALGQAVGTTTSGLSDFYGFSIGAGLRTPFGLFDYALVPYGELGTAHRIAYSYNFGGKP